MIIPTLGVLGCPVPLAFVDFIEGFARKACDAGFQFGLSCLVFLFLKEDRNDPFAQISVYADRTVGGDCDHRHPDWSVASGRAKGS
jgi:hypothetical protein